MREEGKGAYMREISIENAKKVGQTLVTESYRLDEETLVKLAISKEPLDQIEQEKKNAKAALVLGIPALFSFDVVKCGEKYGIIYEHLHAGTFGRQMMEDRDHAEYYIVMYAETLKKLHSTHVTKEELPSVKTVYKKNIMDMGDLLTDEEKEKCCRLIDLVPDRDTFVSRGFEPQNLLYQNNALFLSDFTYSGYGHPLFDLADLSVSLASTSESNLSEDFMDLILNMNRPMTAKLWKGLMHSYFKFDTEKEYKETEELIRYFGRLKNLIMPVLAPNLRDDYKYGTVESSRRAFFPYLDQWTERIKNLKF